MIHNFPIRKMKNGGFNQVVFFSPKKMIQVYDKKSSNLCQVQGLPFNESSTVTKKREKMEQEKKTKATSLKKREMGMLSQTQ